MLVNLSTLGNSSSSSEEKCSSLVLSNPHSAVVEFYNMQGLKYHPERATDSMLGTAGLTKLEDIVDLVRGQHRVARVFVKQREKPTNPETIGQPGRAPFRGCIGLSLSNHGGGWGGCGRLPCFSTRQKQTSTQIHLQNRIFRHPLLTGTF